MIAVVPPLITSVQATAARIIPTNTFCFFGGSSSADNPSTDRVDATDAIGSANVQKLNVIVHKNRTVMTLLPGRLPKIWNTVACIPDVCTAFHTSNVPDVCKKIVCPPKIPIQMIQKIDGTKT